MEQSALKMEVYKNGTIGDILKKNTKTKSLHDLDVYGSTNY